MDKTDKFEWNVGEQEIYPIDYTQEELREANNNKISKIGHANIRKRVVMQKMAGEFWKQEVEPRIQVVRDHLKELDSAPILQTMVSLAKTLDDAIVQLKHPKEKRTETVICSP